MSGGSWDYAYFKLDEVAARLASKDSLTLRRAMAPHVERLALAMKAIEWVDSGDFGEGDDEAAIRAFLDGCGGADAQMLALLVADAKALSEALAVQAAAAEARC